LGRRAALGGHFAVLERTLTGHTNFIWDVIALPGGSRAISASNDGTAALWDLANGLRLRSYQGAPSEVCSVAVDANGTLVIGGCMDGSVLIWQLDQPEPHAIFHHGAADAKVAVISGGDVLTGGADGALKRWREGVVITEVQAHSAPILKVVALGADRVVTVSEDRTARIWSAHDWSCLCVYEGHSGGVNSAAIAPSGQWIVTASDDYSVRLWDTHSGECQRTLWGHSNTVWRVAVDPRERLIASGSGDNTVRLWSAGGEEMGELRHPDCVAAVTFSPDGERLIVGCDDHVLYVYRLPALGARMADGGSS